MKFLRSQVQGSRVCLGFVRDMLGHQDGENGAAVLSYLLVPTWRTEE